MIALEERWCPLCGKGPVKKQLYEANFSANDLRASVFSARRSPDRRHFRLVTCSRCGIVFSDPACSPELLDHLYSRGLVTYEHMEKQIYDSYVPVLSRAVTRLGRRGLFVEVGGGSGFMLRYGVEAGFDTQIEVEPSVDAERRFVAPSERATFIRSALTDTTLRNDSASLVCFFQMLDHVPNPLEFLRIVHKVLEPRGVVVCVTHDSSAVATRLLGKRSPIYDIEHTCLFNARNLGELFAAAGFVDVETYSVANDYAAKYWLSLAPTPAALKERLQRLIERVGVADVRLKLKMGNIAAIGQKASAS